LDACGLTSLLQRAYWDSVLYDVVLLLAFILADELIGKYTGRTFSIWTKFPNISVLHFPFDLVVHLARNYFPFSTWQKKQPPGLIKGICSGFLIRATSQTLVLAAQPKPGQKLRLSKIGVCYPTENISGGDHCDPFLGYRFKIRHLFQERETLCIQMPRSVQIMHALINLKIVYSLPGVLMTLRHSWLTLTHSCLTFSSRHHPCQLNG
jgi:hypothetical protein